MLLFAIAHPIGLGMYGVFGSSITISQLFLIGGAGEVVFGLGVLALWVIPRASKRAKPEPGEDPVPHSEGL